jgi:hypothetical protein
MLYAKKKKIKDVKWISNGNETCASGPTLLTTGWKCKN